MDVYSCSGDGKLLVPIGIHFESLEQFGKSWKSLETIGNQWKPMETKLFQLPSQPETNLERVGKVWGSLGTNRNHFSKSKLVVQMSLCSYLDDGKLVVPMGL